MSEQMNGVVPNAQILNIEHGVVATLEMLLGMARRGQLQACVVVTSEAPGVPGKYVAIPPRIGAYTLAGMAGFLLDTANLCNAESNRKIVAVRPTGLVTPEGKQAMVPVNQPGSEGG